MTDITTPDEAAFERPSKRELDRTVRFFEPWRILTAPKLFGLENVPSEGPMLFVGNHTLFGILDVPMMCVQMYVKRDILLRALGHHMHFKVPFWRDFLEHWGVVDGNRENCARLMAAGEAILVFPGGGREVAKRKDEKYKLIWKERLGFARMAIQHGCPIVPFSAIGIEDAYRIHFDARDLLRSPLGGLINKLGIPRETLIPFATGFGPLPRPHRLYFRFGPAIDTARFEGDYENDSFCWQLRDDTRLAIEEGIQWLRQTRKTDPKRNFLPRVLSELTKLAEMREEMRERRKKNKE